MIPGGQSREPGTQQSLEVWSFWVLAGAVGGAVGGATTFLEFFGPIFLWGLALGAAQALVLPRYLRGNTASLRGLWVLASFLGWFAGWLVLVLVERILTASVPGIHLERVSLVVVWAVFAASQGTILVLMAPAAGRRSLLSPAALWALAGTVGGALAVAASFYLTNAAFLRHGGGGGGYPALVLPGALAQATAGALYGAATGLVLAVIARGGGPGDAHPPRRRPGWLYTTVGLVAFLTLGLASALGLAKLSLTAGCSTGERAILEEFPQYGGYQIDPSPPGPGTASCNIRYFVTDPQEEIFAYYSKRLRENGWEVESQETPRLEARRDGYLYRVEYRGQLRTNPEGGTTRSNFVSVTVSEEPES